MTVSFASLRIAVVVAAENAGDGGVDRLPLLQQLAKDPLSIAGEPVKPLVALVFLAPFAGQQPLRFQAPQQRIERAFIDLQAPQCQSLAQRISVMLLAKLRQNGQGQTAAPQLQPKILK